MVNIIAPINPLGYGVAGFNLSTQLNKIDEVALWPIGGVQVYSQEDAELIRPMIASASLFDDKAPCVRIWHQHDMAQFVGKGEKIGFPIFELDKFNDMEKHHLSKLDKIFVCSEWAKTVVLMNIYRPASDVQVVPLGVDTNVFKPKINESAKTVFFNCGKWEIRKGHDILFTIFEEAFEPQDDVELWMMTTNPFLSEEEDLSWKKMYKNSKLGDKIKFIDRVAQHKEVYNIMEKTDCGIFPSRAEGWNLELLEMLACGKQVITTNYSAHTEFCNQNNSYLVDTPNREVAYDGKWFSGNGGSWAKIDRKEITSFAEAMRKVHEDKQNGRLSINQFGIDTANKYSWENAALKMKSKI